MHIRTVRTGLPAGTFSSYTSRKELHRKPCDYKEVAAYPLVLFITGDGEPDSNRAAAVIAQKSDSVAGVSPSA